MKCQNLFSWKNMKTISKYRLLKILLRELSIKGCGEKGNNIYDDDVVLGQDQKNVRYVHVMLACLSLSSDQGLSFLLT